MLIKLKASQKIKTVSPEDIHGILNQFLKAKHKFDREKEHFWTIGLTARNSIIYIDTVSIGCINGVITEAREIFRFAILKGTVAIIVVHNHPSGNLKPSVADERITNKLVKAGKIIGINVLDHLIITTQWYYSFKEQGRI